MLVSYDLAPKRPGLTWNRSRDRPGDRTDGMLGALKRLLRRSHLLLGTVRAVRHHVTWPLLRSRIVKRYLRTADVKKLNLGTGPDYRLEGWLNTDINPCYSRAVAYLDATRRFPLADRTFDYVHSEHMIEHLTFPQGLGMLRECFRVLRPGGRIRVATPDLRVYVDLFREDGSDVQDRYLKYHVEKFLPDVGVANACFVINNEFRNWGHQFVYDKETLVHAFEQAGFVDLKDRRTGESDDEVLRGIEFHGNVVRNEEMDRFETMVLEARRPD